MWLQEVRVWVVAGSEGVSGCRRLVWAVAGGEGVGGCRR